MRVLIIFPGALGDLMLAGPATRAIARHHSGSPIDLMARGELARFAVGRMGISGAHSIDRPEMSALFRGACDTGFEARAFFGQFDRIYSFFATDDADFRRALIGTTRAHVSFHQFRPPGDGHVSRLYLESVDVGAEQNEFRIDVAPNDLGCASDMLRELGTAAGKHLVLFPGSGSAAKNWPLERFVEVGLELAPLLKPVAVLGPAEEKAEFVLKRAGIASLARLELRVVAALAHLSGGFLGNDSGVSHLAAASGARGLVIFGPTDPSRWRPLGNIAVVRREPLEALTAREVSVILRSTLSIPKK